MEGKNVFMYVLKRSENVKTVTNEITITEIDLSLLFQRFQLTMEGRNNK